jgi:multidrug resistance efflux pump
MSDLDPLDQLRHAYHRLQEARHAMSVSQSQFDTDLATLVAAVTAYETAVATYVAAVGTAAPNLATEDASVQNATTTLATAQTALTAAKP